MADFYVTPENCDAVCGAGRETFEQGGHTRILNANQFPMGSVVMFSTPMAEEDLIPREQWPDLISQKDRNKTWLDDVVGDLKGKNQDSLGYCHGYGPVTALEVARYWAGFPYVELSAESVAGRVTNWSNQGGDPEEDLQVLAKYGACAASFMDRPNSLAHSRWKSGWEADALNHRAEEFLSGIRGKMFDVAATAALRSQPTSPWFNWWSHCTSGSYRLKYDPKTRKFSIKNRNNWGDDWGDRGYYWLVEGTGRGQGTPSGIVVVRVPTPSDK